MGMQALYPLLKSDPLSNFVILATGLFFILTLIYSMGFRREEPKNFQYYFCIILTAIASAGAVLSNNLILLLVFWGILGLTLYILISMGGEGTDAVAKKTFIIVGGSDALMLLGVAVIYQLSGTLQMDSIKIFLNSKLAVFAYLCMAIACFAKAGAMPFHSWIPECAEKAPLPVVAYLPASLDKLLGIYLLARISMDLFVMDRAMNLLLMFIGAFTIIAAVMMALVQHSMKKLLGYHAVSQVGYMVLGIGTGIPIGIAGGLFHMLNHAIYKSCLFFTAGNVQYRTKTTELDELGGIAKLMPLTYVSCLIASLSISGVPPFNGFVSKWMIYQGLIGRFGGSEEHLPVVLCLAAAMFGSGLTLASFMKLIHATYLGQGSDATRKLTGRQEVPWTMWVPTVLLAVICIVFGVFAAQIPLKYFIIPAVGGTTFMGTWYAGVSTLLVIAGLILGVLIFTTKGLKPRLRRDTVYIGGEVLDPEERVTGTDFYVSIKEFGALKGIYKKAEAGYFDIYDQGKTCVFAIGRFFQYLHNGILPTYLVWTLLGMIFLFFALIR
ncbi:MAG: NADH-quinone oxidoreductase subunit L [Deltaproteobacteria bacterium]